jgi:hypothetical protein
MVITICPRVDIATLSMPPAVIHPVFSPFATDGRVVLKPSK